MSIVGIEALEFGAEDLDAGKRFARDFGLSPVREDDSQAVFAAQNGAELRIRRIDDPSLPEAFEAGSTLRRMVWGVADADNLAVYRDRLRDEPGFTDLGDAVECRDPNGLTLRVEISHLKPVELRVPPINQYGDMRRVDEPSPVYDQAEPVSIGHAVFFVDDLETIETFYREKLGFVVSDRYIDRGVFLRMNARGGHHNLFLLKLPHRGHGLNHVAFTVRDIHEVIGGGIAMTRNQWSTFIGPGRHPVSSAYFWYVNSPLGGAFEYYTNEDYLTENWQARAMQHSLESFTEWAVEGGIDADTRRQKKQDA
ncbi:VOC family protein [Saccharospirillum salsuginis]|uniref:Glyoxalase n=1 Tax=Saccharospirillum salsuginis TaxID=418750 RepID=A0A918K2I8_9GAMM|nr:VOC family protein [Saccharospirillum salsuginis]GGX45201.1 glyoxalase [Saccharospirillum salsuginis]